MMKSRPHHYQFAHNWMRATFQRMPETVLARLASEDGIDVIVMSWNDLANRLDEADRLPPDGLAIHRGHTNHVTCEDYFAIVEMPPAVAMTECYYFAMVIRTPDGRIVPESRAEPGRTVQQWYFTLERSLKADFVTPTSILCSWGEDETHYNHGGDYPPDKDAFIEAFSAKLPDPPLAS